VICTTYYWLIRRQKPSILIARVNIYNKMVKSLVYTTCAVRNMIGMVIYSFIKGEKRLEKKHH